MDVAQAHWWHRKNTPQTSSRSEAQRNCRLTFLFYMISSVLEDPVVVVDDVDDDDDHHHHHLRFSWETTRVNTLTPWSR